MQNVLDVLGIVCPVIARILIPLSINFDCRARNLAQRRLFTVLSFFFPIIVGIIYAIRRKSLQKAFKVCSKCGSKADPYATSCPKCGGYMLLEYKNPKEKMLKTISIVLCVVGVLSYCVGEFVGLPSYVDEFKAKIYGLTDSELQEMEEEEEGFVNESGLWYDRNGVAYSETINIKYYDADNTEYGVQYSENDGLVIIDDKGKTYPYDECRIDENGYLLHNNEPLDGKTIFTLDEVYWDYSGQLHTIYE